MKRFTVIIPVFNLSRLIQETIDNLNELSKSFQDFEILFIDDHSTDDTVAKIKSHSKSFDYQILQTKQNSGPGIARSVGINNADAEYLIFLDGDDFLSHDSFSKIDQFLKNNGDPDSVTYGWRYLADTDPKQNRNAYLNTIPKSSKDVPAHFLGGNMDGSIIYTTIKRDILIKNNFKFPPGYHEDISGLFQFYYFSNSNLVLDESLYIKRDRDDSIINTLSRRHIEGLLGSWQIIKNVILEKESYEELDENLTYQYRRGINGLLVSLFHKVIRFNCSSKEKLELYRCVHSILHHDNLIDFSKIYKFPNLSKKDKISLSILDLFKKPELEEPDLEKVIPIEQTIKEFYEKN